MGLHTPLIVWPGHAVGSQRIVNDITQNVDIFPTLAELAGIDVRSYRVDGRSLASYTRERTAGAAGGDATAFAINQAFTGEGND